VDTVVLDKTGTLTAGRPRVTAVRPAGGVDAARLLALAAAVERSSTHPLARAVVAAAGAAGAPAPAPHLCAGRPRAPRVGGGGPAGLGGAAG